MKIVKIFFLFTIITTIFSCTSDEATTADIDRPHTPFAFRSVLDQNARILTVALNEDLWVAYKVGECALYKAWKGEVNFDGPVYTTHHGPQPTSIGHAYQENAISNPWKLLDANGSDMGAKMKYKGHRIVDGHAELMYEMTARGLEKAIEITERPEYATTESYQPIFERRFTTKNVPEGYTVMMDFNTNSIVVPENIKTDGTLKVKDSKQNKIGAKNVLELEGTLSLNSNATTDMNTLFLTDPVIINPLNLGEEEEEDAKSNIHPGARLIATNDCKTCHNKNVRTIGPAYKAVANKYLTTEDNITLLTSKVKNGGTGIWGKQIMNAHPDLRESDIRTMVEYILSLDADTEKFPSGDEKSAKSVTIEPSDIDDNLLIPGVVTKVYQWTKIRGNMPKVPASKKPKYAGVMPNFDNISGDDFKGLDDDFILHAEGFIRIDKDQNYAFRTWSDDGSILYLGGKEIINNDGMHGVEYVENSLFLKKGAYPFRLEYMNGGGGKFISLNWKPEDAEKWAVLPFSNLAHTKDQQKVIGNKVLPMANISKIPGNGSALTEVHPAFTLSQARPDDFEPKVGGIDFLSNGKMIVSTWDPNGSVYMVENHTSNDPSKITYKLIAQGMAEPLGVKVMDDRIFVMQKQEITELVDTNGDDVIDEYRTLSDGWDVSSNFHEFGFGLEGKGDYLYAALATAINPGGASTQPQIQDRGKAIQVNYKTGELKFIASGLRTPNGVGIGYGGDIYIADNQGDWLPSSKILHVEEGDWFGSRSVDFEGTASTKEKKPVVWLPQDEIGNSPSTPLALNVGPYKDQMIHGEVTHGGVKRVFVEEVEGVRQGAVFRFIQGLEAGVNRMRWSPDGSLYVGGIGSTGNWGHNGKKWFGLQRLEYNNTSVFEMLAVRAKTNGIEIEFTEPLQEGEGWNVSDYKVQRWQYVPTKEYGGPKVNLTDMKVTSATVSEDRKKVFLAYNGNMEDHVIYVKLNPFISDNGNSLWSTEAWYTMNKIPQNDMGTSKKSPYSSANNTLTAKEKSEGWELLFDGKKIDQFRNFRKKTLGKSWVVNDGAIHLNSVKKSDGGWQAADGGDIITLKEYEDFDLRLEWKISNCGNSGIIFNVSESEKYDYVWLTGPEMQVLDNTCHPDTRYVTHRAGDLYDLIETKYPTVNPAGEWNKIRILSKDGYVQFYQNGYKVVEFQMHDEQWKEMVANSKFKDMPDFGTFKKGHISLQDHGDKVWYRNIKIKAL